MEPIITTASMTHSKEDGYIGHVVFHMPQQQTSLELTLQSAKGRDWNYSLTYANDQGKEEELFAVEERLENDDDFFDALIDAALASLPEEEAAE
ncbi:hypothetical protein [Paenibacillus sp. YYML68]|uniref:hypothetical protein n=1 Tax=Paenibacillus sp. YYML68 TaxID=2909250 RepID=UPI0024912B5E|nr:hypothetical protein [Paenibacillus sp. YYML68]